MPICAPRGDPQPHLVVDPEIPVLTIAESRRAARVIGCATLVEFAVTPTYRVAPP